MDATRYRKIVFALDLKSRALCGRVELALADPALEAGSMASLLELQDTVCRLHDDVRLMRYADPAALADDASPEFQRGEQEFEHLRVDSAALKTIDLDQLRKQVERGVFGIIKPLGVVGKWPPDRPVQQAPGPEGLKRGVVGPWPPK